MGKYYSIVEENEIWTFIFSTILFCIFVFLSWKRFIKTQEIGLVNLFQMFTEHGGDRAHWISLVDSITSLLSERVNELRNLSRNASQGAKKSFNMGTKIEYVDSNHLHATNYIRNSKAIAVLWAIFTICYAIISAVAFFTPGN